MNILVPNYDKSKSWVVQTILNFRPSCQWLSDENGFMEK